MSDPPKPPRERTEWLSVDVVTGEVTGLPDAAEIELTHPIAADGGQDPRSRAEPTGSMDGTVEVRTLDEMRLLSEKIKQGREP
jgi:hypothetical protein